MPEPTLAERLAHVISSGGPVPVAHFMAAANTHYYATRDPLGVDGDFITAPEISQMFGELVGLWLADLWLRTGKPDVAYVELGPGRGTLARDIVRAMALVGLSPDIHFVETSPVLRAVQRRNVPKAQFHDDISSLPEDRPLLIVANEFFDALPAQQLIMHEGAWHQALVACEDGVFGRVVGNAVPSEIIPENLRTAPPGSIIETSPPCVGIMRMLATRIVKQGGAGVVIDYGYVGPALGDTLQAVKAHKNADPFADPGEQDMTVHVDFGTLGAAADLIGVRVLGPVGQGQWLMRLGLAERTVALSAISPDRADQLASERDRLASGHSMGDIFRVMAIVSPDWPEPDGF